PTRMWVSPAIAPDCTSVGDRHHERAGLPHAEIVALDDARPRARGATLICTLEPCAHRGRPGPCVVRIVAAGIQTIVAATEDPNPIVSGRGFQFLESHGVKVGGGVEAAAAERLNTAFFSSIHPRGRV